MTVPKPNSVLAWAGQIIFFVLFIALLMFFSNSPRYQHFPAGQALIKLSFSHAGQVKGECRMRSKEELAKLSPNMRVREVCPRERSEIQLELEMDGKLIFSGSLPPSGVKRDGLANVYKRFAVSTGQHRLVARMKDHEKLIEYNYSKQMDINLAAKQVFVIDFEAETGGFIFR